jgi:phytol kinase
MLLVSVVYLAMFGVGELLHRRWHVSAEATRRLDHLAAGGIALALPFAFGSPWPVVALAAAFLAFLTGARLLGLLGSVHGVGRRSIGAFLYPLAIATTFVLSAEIYPHYAIAVLALATADVAAGVAGQRWGRHAYSAWGQGKTVEGSLAAFGVAGALCTTLLLIGDVSLGVAVATGILTGGVVALVEGALPWGLDNLGIPLAALVSLSAAGSVVSGGLAVVGAAVLLAVAVATSRLTQSPAANGQPRLGS